MSRSESSAGGRKHHRLVWILIILTLVAGCTAPDETTDDAGDAAEPPMGPGDDGAPVSEDLAALVLPPGVTGEVVAGNLAFPTSVDWDENGTMYIGIAGFAGEEPQILRVEEDGTTTPLPMEGANMTPQLLDITFHEGNLYFSTTAKVHVHNFTNGTTWTLINDLPAWGDHRTNELVFGPDGRMYVGQGTVTNSGVVGLDQLGVPDAVNAVAQERPGYHDIPCETIQVTGVNYETINAQNRTVNISAYRPAAVDANLTWINSTTDLPPDPGQGERVITGPFAPFGEPRVRGETVEGFPKCNGAVLSANPDGSDVRAVAWGFRNPFGVSFDAAGNLWVSNNGYDNRGSRPVGATPDELWRVNLGEGGEGGIWHGWPDYSAGIPVTDPFYSPLYGPDLEPLVLTPPNPVPEPATFFSAHSSSNKFDFAPAGTPFEGDLFIAEFGTLNLEFVLGALTGMDVAHVDLDTGRVTQFIYHEDRYSGKFRPVEAIFGPDDRMYVVDFGQWVIEEGNVTVSQGASVQNAIRPGTGRILAFTLPDELPNATEAWTPFPVGNVGQDGTTPRNVEVVQEVPEGIPTLEAFDYGFGPVQGTARVGEPVAFVNKGDVGHTVTQLNGTFNTGWALPPNATVVWTPQEPGIYEVYCEVHPVMRGRIVVQAAGVGANETNET